MQGLVCCVFVCVIGEDVFQSQQGKPLPVINNEVYKDDILEHPQCDFWLPDTCTDKVN